MRDVILIGEGKRIREQSAATWRRHLAGAGERCRERLAFMTPEHHAVRDLRGPRAAPESRPTPGPRSHRPRGGAAAAPGRGDPRGARAPALLPGARRRRGGRLGVHRDRRADPPSAPVLERRDPVGRLSGRRDCDALRARALAEEELSIEIESECVHCGRRSTSPPTTSCRWSVAERGARPLIFEPDVDWGEFEAPTIVDDY